MSRSKSSKPAGRSKRKRYCHSLGTAPGAYVLAQKICQANSDQHRIEEWLCEVRIRSWDRALALEESQSDLTINKFLDDAISAVQLEFTISSLEDTPEQWNQGEFQLPTNAHSIIHYILALFAGTLLISDDFETAFVALAHSIMLANGVESWRFPIIDWQYSTIPTVIYRYILVRHRNIGSVAETTPLSTKHAPAVPSSSTLKMITLITFCLQMFITGGHHTIANFAWQPVVKKKQSNAGPQNIPSGDADKPTKAPKLSNPLP
ncbi:hypothetical protein K438DRAFT_1778346 [Mycena galopus ATCC 62051]|nr:hypothetical protein K438DRAFT_1778346 [Mycena galopus ATCC 62051]